MKAFFNFIILFFSKFFAKKTNRELTTKDNFSEILETFLKDRECVYVFNITLKEFIYIMSDIGKFSTNNHNIFLTHNDYLVEVLYESGTKLVTVVKPLTLELFAQFAAKELVADIQEYLSKSKNPTLLNLQMKLARKYGGNNLTFRILKDTKITANKQFFAFLETGEIVRK